jgi:hypothetical protein
VEQLVNLLELRFIRNLLCPCLLQVAPRLEILQPPLVILLLLHKRDLFQPGFLEQLRLLFRFSSSSSLFIQLILNSPVLPLNLVLLSQVV